jgi:DNA polymerase
MPTLYIDVETYSEVPISAGTHAYAEGAEIIVAAWAVDDGPVEVCAVNGDIRNTPVYPLLMDEALTICAHNSHFDRTVLRHAAKLDIPVDRWTDTMVTALAHGLPGALAKLCEILHVPVDQAKDRDGKRLIQLFCVPRPKNMALRRATPETHPEEWQRFLDYARLDIEAMRAIDKKLPKWNLTETERRLWCLDQNINDRGVLIDLALVDAALVAVNTRQKELAEETFEITDGALTAATQRDLLIEFIAKEYGITLGDVKGSTVEKMLQDDTLPPDLRQLLTVRAQAATTSTAKYKALKLGVNWDARLRGTLQFCGASRTGRWAGRVFQPQNLPRPTLKNAEINAGIEDLKAGRPVADVMALASSALRGTIIAPKGKKLVVADLSNIEGRVLAWLAGEDWKLHAFAEFDEGTGHDLYKLAYARSFGVKPEAVTKEQRQIGKVQELALGYEGGVGAFVTFAGAYGIDLDAMAGKAAAALNNRLLGQAKDAYLRAVKDGRPTFGLADKTWIVCDAIKRAWREAHPATARLWGDLQSAMIAAIQNEGEYADVNGLISFTRRGHWTLMKLPSCRVLCYPAARADDGLSYAGTSQFTRKWERIGTYSGKLAENATQAVARDVLGHGMLAAEAAGYRIVLSVHDELIAEVPDTDAYSADTLARIMSTPPRWAPGLPLAAAGFETDRYKKED